MDVTLPEIDIASIKDTKLASQVTQLINLVEEILQKVDSLIQENILLKQENSRLKKQSKPPMFSGKDYSATKRMKTVSPVWKKGKKKGMLAVDQVISIPKATVCICGGKEFTTIRTHERVVQDIIIKRNNILYQWVDQKCAGCGDIYKGALPDEVKGQEFGASLRSWTSVLKYDYRFTLPLLHRLYSGLDIKISTGELSGIILTNSTKLAAVYTYLKVWGIKLSKYLQTDATGMKRKVARRSSTITRQHLHFLGHTLLSLFTITGRYNTEAIRKFLGKAGLNKPFVSDDASCYGEKLMILYKQLCWLHEIRHYLKLDPKFNHHKKKLDETIGLLWKFYQQAKAYCLDPTENKRNELETLFDLVTCKTTGYRELDHRLELTRRKQERLLVFLTHPYLPIHNNQSEQDVRDAVMIRMISRETKSKAGDRSLERHLSIIHTAKKQGLDVFETINGFLTGALSPSILIAKIV